MEKKKREKTSVYFMHIDESDVFVRFSHEESENVKSVIQNILLCNQISNLWGIMNTDQ